MNRLLATLLAALLALAAVGVAACGGDDEEDGDVAGGTAAPTETRASEPSEEPVATLTIRETEFELNPSTPTVDRPGTVEITARNVGEIVHALVVETPSGEAETGDIQPGESETILAELTEPGEYTMYCPVGNHRELGMEGTITVRGPEGGDAGGPATSPKQESDGAEAGDDTGPATQPEREPPPEGEQTEPPVTREQGSGY